MVQKNAQKEYEKLSAQVNDLQNQVNDNQINIPSDTQTETENVAQEVQTEDSELEQKGIEIPQKNLNWKKLKGVNQDAVTPDNPPRFPECRSMRKYPD